MDEYYAHTIRISNFRIRDFDNLEKIFQCGYLLSRRGQRQNGDKSIDNSILTALFNGMDYISLCDLKMSHDGNSAYNMYTRRGLSLLIDRNIQVIVPTKLPPYDYNYFNPRVFLGNKRFTDLIDEVQVKDSIDLSHLKGMCLSLSVFKSFYNEEYIEYYLKYLKELLDEYKHDVPLYNLDSREKIKIK